MTDALSAAQREDLRRVLVVRMTELQELDELSADSRHPVELDQQSVGRLSRMDAIQQQAMALASQGRRQHDIRLIAQALTRMATEEYGYCGTCGNPIPFGRLKLDPTVARCVDCANEK